MPRPLKFVNSFSRQFKQTSEHEEHSYYSKNGKKSLSKCKKNNFIPIDSINSYDSETDIVYEEIITIEDTSIYLENQNSDNIRVVEYEKSNNNFLEKLRNWAVSQNIKHTQLSSFLKILKEETNIVNNVDARTLLRTPTRSKDNYIKNMGDGKYLHFTIKESIVTILESFDEKKLLEVSPYLELSFNVDGTPISKSGGNSFWIILGCINNMAQKVFPIGIYKGVGKPKNGNEFLEKFVNEMSDLITDGVVFKSKIYKFIIHSFLCDAPAMAFIKQVKSHGGYYSCQKCFIKGESLIVGSNKRKVIYSQLNYPLRTDVTFRNRIDHNGHTDNVHHKENRSILEQLPVDMIKHFPLDKMHLVDEGVTKKLIQIWLGKPSAQKLSFIEIQKLNEHLKLLNKYSCSEFQRKVRTLDFAAYMKASEFRVFLLYTGPVILKRILKPSIYKHFLCYSLAVRILTSPVYYRLYNSYADDLLNYFVKHFPKLYGLKNMTYNVHNLIHLANDVRDLGPADENSCYKFESYIKTIKSWLHSSNRPLEQCYNRVKERSKIKTSKDSKVSPYLDKNITNTNFYEKCIFSNFIINCNSLGNNCIMLRSKKIVRIKYFEKTRNKIFIHGQNFCDQRIINNEPSDLKEFNMVFGKFSTNIFKHDIRDLEKDIICKICFLPYTTDTFYVSPLNHTLRKFDD